MRFLETRSCAKNCTRLRPSFALTHWLSLTLMQHLIFQHVFCEGNGTRGNAYHLSGFSADTPTLTDLDLVVRSCKARLLDKLDSATLNFVERASAAWEEWAHHCFVRGVALPLLVIMKPRGP